MPLYCHGKLLIFDFDRLDQAVFRIGHCINAGGKRLDRLVVITVDAMDAFSDDVCEFCAFQYLHIVGGSVVGRCHVVFHPAFIFTRQILVERASETGVYELDASADAEKRLMILQTLVQ